MLARGTATDPLDCPNGRPRRRPPFGQTPSHLSVDRAVRVLLHALRAMRHLPCLRGKVAYHLLRQIFGQLFRGVRVRVMVFLFPIRVSCET